MRDRWNYESSTKRHGKRNENRTHNSIPEETKLQINKPNVSTNEDLFLLRAQQYTNITRIDRATEIQKWPNYTETRMRNFIARCLFNISCSCVFWCAAFGFGVPLPSPLSSPCHRLSPSLFRCFDAKEVNRETAVVAERRMRCARLRTAAAAVAELLCCWIAFAPSRMDGRMTIGELDSESSWTPN